ncbi:MAG: hypothetical protein ABI925_08070 [Verrucomicrobiota bacterium]
MKKLICILLGAGLIAACEQKETTVTPAAEKETNTTVVKDQAPATEKKTEKTETNINLGTSPAPSP